MATKEIRTGFLVTTLILSTIVWIILMGLNDGIQAMNPSKFHPALFLPYNSTIEQVASTRFSLKIFYHITTNPPVPCFNTSSEEIFSTLEEAENIVAVPFEAYIDIHCQITYEDRSMQIATSVFLTISGLSFLMIFLQEIKNPNFYRVFGFTLVMLFSLGVFALSLLGIILFGAEIATTNRELADQNYSSESCLAISWDYRIIKFDYFRTDIYAKSFRCNSTITQFSKTFVPVEEGTFPCEINYFTCEGRIPVEPNSSIEIFLLTISIFIFIIIIIGVIYIINTKDKRKNPETEKLLGSTNS
jgi:hypothetical protein